MTESLNLYGLLMEDDPDTLRQLQELLPVEIAGCNICWDPCSDFEEAIRRLGVLRYDIVATDIYRDRENKNKLTGKEKAKEIIETIRDKQFCPIVAFTDGSSPESFHEGPFIRFADKSKTNDIAIKLEELIQTGLPGVARRIHNDLSAFTGSYLWGFLEKNWEQLKQRGSLEPALLERLVRRRAAIQLSRLELKNDNLQEVDKIEGLEFYIYPSIAGRDFRLGEVISAKSSVYNAGEKEKQALETPFRVILTPHCHLTTQPSDPLPRASYVLTVRTVDASKLLSREKGKDIRDASSENKRSNLMRKLIQSPAEVGKPSGRYWFVPGFLEIPDLYCDFLQLESIDYTDLQEKYNRIAVLDTPFAEALQSCFLRFYSAIGLPNLGSDRFQYLIKGSES